MAEDDDYEDLIDNLEQLEDMSDEPEKKRLVRRSIGIARKTAATPRTFGQVIRGFDRRDVGEAFIGSLVFGIPMVVEGGTLEIGEYLAMHPLLGVSVLLFGVLLAIKILYVVDFQQVEIVNPIFGIIPRRLVGVLGVSYGTALVAMTVTGRVDWAVPWTAFNQVNVTFVAMVIGASLGDILPGT